MTEDEQNAEAKIYEAIGRYAVAYELFVHELREGCLFFMCPNIDGLDNRQAQRLAEVPLHSPAMGAEALMRVFEALVGETLIRLEETAKEKGQMFPEAERAAITGVMKRIRQECKELPEIRNTILHAVYFIGFNDQFEDPGFYKRRLTGEGLDFPENPPKSAADFDSHRNACEAATKLVSQFLACFVLPSGPHVSRSFELRNQGRGKSPRWERRGSP